MLTGDHVVKQAVGGKGLKACLTSEYISKQGMLTREDESTQGTLARRHARRACT